MGVAGDPPNGKTVVHFWEDNRILAIIDRVAKNKGTDRSAICREANRFYLASNSHLTAEEKKDLGINGASK
jgi:metal-responsive CopG/Arc/MetJ family transcriptional regulator